MPRTLNRIIAENDYGNRVSEFTLTFDAWSIRESFSHNARMEDMANRFRRLAARLDDEAEIERRKLAPSPPPFTLKDADEEDGMGDNLLGG